MKHFLLVLFLAGCTTGATNKGVDAGASAQTEAYIKHKINMNWIKYYPACVRLCYKYADRDDCSEKCENDFKQINKLLVRMVKENKEDDFDAVMDGWYGQN